jgi:hypothetical protein
MWACHDSDALNTRVRCIIRLCEGYGGTSVRRRANGKGDIYETDVDCQDFIKTQALAIGAQPSQSFDI